LLWLFLQRPPATRPRAAQNATFLADAQLTQWTNTGPPPTLDAATRKQVYAEVQQRAIDPSR